VCSVLSMYYTDNMSCDTGIQTGVSAEAGNYMHVIHVVKQMVSLYNIMIMFGNVCFFMCQYTSYILFAVNIPYG
jgi:hypothetical protein